MWAKETVSAVAKVSDYTEGTFMKQTGKSSVTSTSVPDDQISKKMSRSLCQGE